MCCVHTLFLGSDNMYMLKVEASFDSAHFLSGYDGKCRNIHGHRWKVEAVIKSSALIENGQQRGMVTDFSILKRNLKEAADNFDHALIYERGSLKENTLACLKDENFRLIEVEFRPTAENLAKYFYSIMKSNGYGVDSVTVYETPNNCAIYMEDKA